MSDGKSKSGRFLCPQQINKSVICVEIKCRISSWKVDLLLVVVSVKLFFPSFLLLQQGLSSCPWSQNELSIYSARICLVEATILVVIELNSQIILNKLFLLGMRINPVLKILRLSLWQFFFGASVSLIDEVISQAPDLPSCSFLHKLRDI